MNPRKPTNLKVLQGTFRQDRAAKHEPKPEIAMPPVPEHLGVEAKAEWDRIAKELLQLGLLTRIDRAALTGYCECWADFVDASRRCATTPEGQDMKVIRTPAGTYVENPYFYIKRRSLELMHRYLVEFGMTPGSRTKIDALPLPADKPGNPFASIK